MDNLYTKYVFVVDLLTGKNVLQRNILGGKKFRYTFINRKKNIVLFCICRKNILVWTESSTPTLFVCVVSNGNYIINGHKLAFSQLRSKSTAYSQKFSYRTLMKKSPAYRCGN